MSTNAFRNIAQFGATSYVFKQILLNTYNLFVPKIESSYGQLIQCLVFQLDHDLDHDKNYKKEVFV